MESYEILKVAMAQRGIKSIAAEIGLSESLLYKWSQEPGEGTDTDKSGVKNPLDRTLELYQLTNDLHLIHWLCERAGGFFVRNPQGIPHDNVDAAAALALLLGSLGHDVVVAHDGPTALDAVAAHGPEICLLDIGLPGMDGYELARRIRALPQGAQPLLVALTGYGQESDRRTAAAAGFDRYVVKPLDADELLTLLGT